MVNVLKRYRKQGTEAQRRGHIKMEVEVGVMCLQVKQYLCLQSLQAIHQKLEEAEEDPHLASSEKAELCQTLDSGLGSRTV